MSTTSHTVLGFHTVFQYQGWEPFPTAPTSLLDLFLSLTQLQTILTNELQPNHMFDYELLCWNKQPAPPTCAHWWQHLVCWCIQGLFVTLYPLSLSLLYMWIFDPTNRQSVHLIIMKQTPPSPPTGPYSSQISSIMLIHEVCARELEICWNLFTHLMEMKIK